MIFLLLTGCGSMQYSEEIWAPEKVPTMYGEDNEMRDIAARCNGEFYKGFSTQNLAAKMTEQCRPLRNGNMLCAMEAVDEYTYLEDRDVYDDKKKTWVKESKRQTGYRTYMINVYIKPPGLVYDCKAERGEHKLFAKKVDNFSIGTELPHEEKAN